MNFYARMFVRAAILGSLVFFLSGCTSVNALYPKFKEQSAGLKSVAITTDVMVLEDVKGPLPLVDVPRDTNLAHELNRHIQTELEKRGIKVIMTEQSSVGLRYATAVTPEIKVRGPGQASEIPLTDLGTASAPYFVSPFYSEPALRANLQNVYEDMRRYVPKVGSANLVSSHVTRLPPVEGADYRMFVLVEGVQIPMSKGLTQAIATGLLTLGTVAVYQMTTVPFRVGIADARTGEFILIIDCTIAGGWTVHADYLRRQAGIFFAQFDRLRR